MNKLLKALVIGLGLAVSLNANSAAWALIILNNKPKPAVVQDKWFASCNYAKSDILPEGFGCDVKGEIVSVQDFAKSEKLNVSKLRVYKHKNIFNDHVSVIVEEIR
jgi:hypothetical protein